MTGQAKHRSFTADDLRWSPWLAIIAPGEESPAQAEVLAETGPQASQSAFFRTLVHEPEILRHRSQVYNGILYARGGLPRAERELASTVVSRINGCVYCASVHARRFQQLAKRGDLIEQVFADPATAGDTPRAKAIVALAINLTLDPASDHLDAMRDARAAGLGDLELIDLVQTIAIFAWANRLMLSLGEVAD